MVYLIHNNLTGGLVFAKLFQTPAIIINSYDVARDLMEKRSGNYSDRPRFILIVEMYVHTVMLILCRSYPLVEWDGITL